MYYEIGRIPYFPKFHGYKAMKHFDRQIGDFAGRWDRGMTGVDPGWQKGEEAIVF